MNHEKKIESLVQRLDFSRRINKHRNPQRKVCDVWRNQISRFRVCEGRSEGENSGHGAAQMSLEREREREWEEPTTSAGPINGFWWC